MVLGLLQLFGSFHLFSFYFVLSRWDTVHGLQQGLLHHMHTGWVTSTPAASWQNQKIRKKKSFFIFARQQRGAQASVSHHHHDWSSTQEVKLPEDLMRMEQMCGNWSSFSKTSKKLAVFWGDQDGNCTRKLGNFLWRKPDIYGKADLLIPTKS